MRQLHEVKERIAILENKLRHIAALPKENRGALTNSEAEVITTQLQQLRWVVGE